MPQDYKRIFNDINQSRARRGLPRLKWYEFVGGRKRVSAEAGRRIQDYVEPDPPRKIKRPPAVYSNQSIYDKYGV